MIKFIIIGAYITHKVYWKRKHKENTIEWTKFFPKKAEV